MTNLHHAHTAMRTLLRASWWIAMLLLCLLPLAAVLVQGLTWPDVAAMDLIVITLTGAVLWRSTQARAGLKMLPTLMWRPRPRRTGGLTAAHLSL